MSFKEGFLEFAASRIRKKELELEGFGKVWIRVLRAREQDNLAVAMKDGGEKEFAIFRSSLVACCLCDETGERIFTDAEIDKVGELPTDLVSKLFEAAYELNGMGAKAVDVAEKN